MTRYCAKPGLRIPMPDRPGQLVPETGDGIQVPELSPYYQRMIADGDLVEATDETPPAGGKPEGKK